MRIIFINYQFDNHILSSIRGHLFRILEPPQHEKLLEKIGLQIVLHDKYACSLFYMDMLECVYMCQTGYELCYHCCCGCHETLNSYEVVVSIYVVLYTQLFLVWNRVLLASFKLESNGYFNHMIRENDCCFHLNALYFEPKGRMQMLQKQCSHLASGCLRFVQEQSVVCLCFP